MNEIQRRVGYLKCSPQAAEEIQAALYGRGQITHGKFEQAMEIVRWWRRYHQTSFGSKSAKLRVVSGASGGNSTCH